MWLLTWEGSEAEEYRLFENHDEMVEYITSHAIDDYSAKYVKVQRS